jgi:hypothetical protein
MNFTRRITDYNNPRSPGFRFRAARAKKLAAMIERICAAQGRCRILDLGGTESYWRVVDARILAASNCHITLLNVVAPDVTDRERFTAIAGDACTVGKTDGSFDLVHSNSTIEHVGEWGRMSAFAAEVRRLAPAYFVQTPAFWFPWEPHFGVPLWHWLPEPVRVALLMRRGFGHIARAATVSSAVLSVQHCHLIDARMMAALFPDGKLIRERVLGLTKSFVAVRDG